MLTSSRYTMATCVTGRQWVEGSAAGGDAPCKERLITSHKGSSHLGLSTRVSIMDTQGQVVARWDSPSAHGSWVDAHGDIYLALGTRTRVDKYVRQG